RVDVLDGCVGPVPDDGPGLDQVSPRVGGSPGALLSEPSRYPGPVGGGVDALHCGDHAEPAEARNVHWVDVLRVFDAPAQFGRVRDLGEAPLVEVEDFAVRAVPDRV